MPSAATALGFEGDRVTPICIESLSGPQTGDLPVGSPGAHQHRFADGQVEAVAGQRGINRDLVVEVHRLVPRHVLDRKRRRDLLGPVETVHRPIRPRWSQHPPVEASPASSAPRTRRRPRRRARRAAATRRARARGRPSCRRAAGRPCRPRRSCRRRARPPSRLVPLAPALPPARRPAVGRRPDIGGPWHPASAAPPRTAATIPASTSCHDPSRRPTLMCRRLSISRNMLSRSRL